MFLSSKVSHANIVSYSDRDRKGLIEYTLIPCCRLNRQVTLAVYFFYPSHRFQWNMSRRLEGKQLLRLGSPSLWVFSSVSILLTVFFVPGE